MADLVDVLAVLVRKGFGTAYMQTPLGMENYTSSYGASETLTLRTLYELEERFVTNGCPAVGDWTSRMSPEGRLVVTDGTRTFTEIL